MPAGRPSLYSDELAEDICARIAFGESVRQISLLDEMPEEKTIYRWLIKYPEFCQKYTLAKEFQTEKFNEDIIDIADDNRNDWVERENQRTGETYIALNEEALGRAKIRIDARKWLMGKNKPKKYGDKIQVGGADDLPPVRTQSTLDVSSMTIEQLEALQAALGGQAALAGKQGE